MSTEETGKKPVQKHHVQEQLCETRPPYRQGKKLTAVKVYTVASESQHLYVFGVPKINLRPELKNLCMRYGVVKNIHVVADCETEIFTECYHVQYERIQSARIAKRTLDNRSFYGHLLHVCYVPEYETIDETRAKLNQRRLEVTRRINGDYPEYIGNKGGDGSGTKRNFIDEIEDPILAKRLCKGDIGTSSHALRVTSSTLGSESFKVVDDAIVYGPFLPDYRVQEELSEEAGTVLLPAPVVKSNLNICAKRIVFKKKRFGLDD